MATNFVQDGNVVTLTAPAGGCKSGDPLLIGAFFGVATTDADAGEDVETAVTGVWDLPSAGAFGQGAACYWDSVAKKVTAVATAHPHIGVALVAVGSSGTLCRVRLGFAAMAPAA